MEKSFYPQTNRSEESDAPNDDDQVHLVILASLLENRVEASSWKCSDIHALLPFSPQVSYFLALIGWCQEDTSLGIHK